VNSKWDARFISMANLIASWSKDSSSKVGAVIADENNRIVSLGYNGFAQTVSDDLAITREDKLAMSIHAEANAILFAKYIPSKSRLYCTHFCCSQCASIIVQAKEIVEVVFAYPEGQVADYTRRWYDNLQISAKVFGGRVNVRFHPGTQTPWQLVLNRFKPE